MWKCTPRYLLGQIRYTLFFSKTYLSTSVAHWLVFRGSPVFFKKNASYPMFFQLFHATILDCIEFYVNRVCKIGLSKVFWKSKFLILHNITYSRCMFFSKSGICFSFLKPLKSFTVL